MPIKFLYPDPKQKEMLDELEKINYVLNKPLSPELQKNMRFVKNFTLALFKVTKKQPIQKPIEKKQEIVAKPLEIKSLPQPKEVKPLAPPPPPPPSISVQKHPSSPISTKLKKTGNLLKYESLEPEMQPQDWKIFTKVKNIIKEQLQKNPNILENSSFLEKEIQKVAEELKIKTTPDYTKKIKYYLVKHIKGFGRIDPLIQDEKVASIICNAYNNISVVYDSEPLQTNIKFRTNEEMNSFVINLAEKFDKKLSENTPTLEFSTDKYKININYNPLMGRSSFKIDKL